MGIPDYTGTHVTPVPQSDETALEIYPTAVAEPSKLYAMSQRMIHLHPEEEFPQGSRPMGLYNKTLIDVPFAIVSGHQFRIRPANTLPDGRRFEAREEVQVYIRLLTGHDDADPATWGLAEPQLATLHGAYLVNQFKALTQRDLDGQGLFTLKRNTRQKPLPSSTPGNPQYPVMLARWTYTPQVAETYDEPALAPLVVDGLNERGLTLADVSEATGYTTSDLRVMAPNRWRDFFARWDKQQALSTIEPGASVTDALSTL